MQGTGHQHEDMPVPNSYTKASGFSHLFEKGSERFPQKVATNNLKMVDGRLVVVDVGPTTYDVPTPSPDIEPWRQSMAFKAVPRPQLDGVKDMSEEPDYDLGTTIKVKNPGKLSYAFLAPCFVD